MTDMVEKMARDIARAHAFGEDRWDRLDEIRDLGPHKEMYRTLARAAIRALMEPTEESGLLELAALAVRDYEANNLLPRMSWEHRRGIALAAVQTMLKAALDD